MSEYTKDFSERRIDSDLESNFEYNGSGMPGFRLEDIAYVLAALMGENDGPDYHWIVAMKDHTYAYVTGGCDYTGWDCQSSGSSEIVPSLREALANAPKELQPLLKSQLTGDKSFGESTPEDK